MYQRKAWVAILAVVVGLSLAAVVQAGMVVEWRFEGNLNDSTVNANNGTATGTTSYVTGVFGGQALNLASDAMVANTSAVNLPSATTASWSTNYWLNLSSAPAQLADIGGFGSLVANVSRPRNTINYPDGQFSFWADATPTVVGVAGTGFTADGTWHMYTVTYDGSTSTITTYKDGTQVASQAMTSGVDPDVVSGLGFPSGSLVHVGGPSNWAINWAGSVDEFTIWNNALTSPEVSGLLVPEPATMALLAFGGIGMLVSRKRRK